MATHDSGLVKVQLHPLGFSAVDIVDPTVFGAGSAPSAISGSTSFAFSAAGELAATGVLSASGSFSFSISGDLTNAAGGVSPISGSASFSFTTTAEIVGAGILGGSSAFAFSPSGEMLGRGALLGASALSFAASGALTNAAGGVSPISGSSQFTFSALGGLSNAAQLAAAGRPRRKRWAVEVDGEYLYFSSAQAAIGFLTRQNKKAKAKARIAAGKIDEKPEIIPFSAITFDGERISRMMIQGKTAAERIKTMRDAEIAMVERVLRQRADDDEAVINLLAMFG